MANIFQCDKCKKQTFVNPPTEPVFSIDAEGNKIPVMITLKSMDFATGKMIETQVQKQVDLQPRAHIIRLVAGQQLIQKDFCSACLQHVMPEIKSLWDRLEDF
jgi:hypothetical protein